MWVSFAQSTDSSVSTFGDWSCAIFGSEEFMEVLPDLILQPCELNRAFPDTLRGIDKKAEIAAHVMAKSVREATNRFSGAPMRVNHLFDPDHSPFSPRPFQHGYEGIL